MRADTWGEVWEAAQAFGGALVSRLRYYARGEQARRAELDAKRLAMLKAAIAEANAHGDDAGWAQADDDAMHVEAWMAENGFTQTSDSYGVDEQMEGAITAATEAFRQRLAEIIGKDEFPFYVHVGIDNDEETE